MSKKIKLSLVFVSLLLTPSLIHADTLNLTTYYPAPFGSYSQLFLLPTDTAPTCAAAADEGRIYYDLSEGQIKVCHGATGWDPVGPWKQNGAYTWLKDSELGANAAWKVGIGVSSPLMKLHLKQDGGILASGTFGSGTAIGTFDSVGAGTRFLWYPVKAAIRAGGVDGTQWNDTSIGNYSVAFGENNTASEGTVSMGGSGHTFVGGGKGNTASQGYATIVGGSGNTANNYWSFVGGGITNTASGLFSTIAGGGSLLGGNTASGDMSAILGGTLNSASNPFSTVGGGIMNRALNDHALIAGGGWNQATGPFSVVVGGGGGQDLEGNIASGDRSFIGGGSYHRATGANSVIVGGSGNGADGSLSFVGGGQNNFTLAAAGFSVVGGGLQNQTLGATAVVAGGWDNQAGDRASIVGGMHNRATVINSFIGAGENNLASGGWSVVAGGGGDVSIPTLRNTASGQYSAITGGNTNTASGANSFIGGGKNNIASGIGSTIPGGINNQATGNYSAAMGFNAAINGNNSFVWGGDGAATAVAASDVFVVFPANEGAMLVGSAANAAAGGTTNGPYTLFVNGTIGGDLDGPGGGPVGKLQVTYVDAVAAGSTADKTGYYAVYAP